MRSKWAALVLVISVSCCAFIGVMRAKRRARGVGSAAASEARGATIDDESSAGSSDDRMWPATDDVTTPISSDARDLLNLSNDHDAALDGFHLDGGSTDLGPVYDHDEGDVLSGDLFPRDVSEGIDELSSPVPSALVEPLPAAGRRRAQ